ncbi:hypothetical protein M9458_001410, partial [Cirrhinus mrigala]
MEIAARFSTLARRDLPFVEYAWEFCKLAMRHHRTELEERDPPVSGECPDPIQNQPTGPPRAQPTHTPTEPEPEPTADRQPEPRATEPSPMGVTAREIATEPEPIESDQVREPTTMPATVDVPVGREGAEDSTAHCTAKGERCLNLGHLNVEQDLIDFSEDIYVELPAYPEQSVCLELSACLDFPPTLPLLSPPISPAASVLPPLSPDSPAAHPQPTICAVGSPRVCQSPSASWLEDPSSLAPASESWTLPRPFRLSDFTPALSSLVSTVAHWSTSSTGLYHPSGSALVGRRPVIASGLHSSGCVLLLHPTGSVGLLPPSSSASVLCCFGSAADLRISASASFTRALGSALALLILGVTQDHRLAVSTLGSTSTCSTAVCRPPGVSSPSSAMAPPSVGPAVGYHNGCGLGLTWLLLLRVPSVSSLAPPSVVTTRPSPEPPPTPTTFCYLPTSTPLVLFLCFL